MMSNDYQVGISRPGMRIKRQSATLENEPLAYLFEGLLNTSIKNSPKQGLVWNPNKTLLKKYFKNKASFTQFIYKNFPSEEYSLKQVIDKRVNGKSYNKSFNIKTKL